MGQDWLFKPKGLLLSGLILLSEISIANPSNVDESKKTNDSESIKPGLPVKEYIEFRLTKDGRYVSQQFFEKIAKENVNYYDQSIESSIGLRPYWQNESVDLKADLPSGPVSEAGDLDQISLESQLDLDLPTATSMYLTYKFPFKDQLDGENVTLTKEQYTLGLRQSLGKNFFGTSRDIQKYGSSQKLKLEEVKLNKEASRVCSEALGQYKDAYILQEKIAIIGEMTKAAKELYDRAKKDFSKQLIDKSDYLGVRLDYITFSESLLSSKNDLSLIKRQMEWKAEDFSLLVPESYFSNVNQRLIEAKESQLKEEIAIQSEIVDSEARLAAENAKSQIDLFIEGQNTSVRSGEVTDVESDYIMVGLQVDVPLLGRRVDTDERIAYLNRARDLAVKKLEFRTIDLQISRLKEYISDLKARESLIKDAIEISKEQVKASEKLLKYYRTNFAEHRRVRDKLLQRKLAYLDLISQRWGSVLELAKIIGKQNTVCSL